MPELADTIEIESGLTSEANEHGSFVRFSLKINGVEFPWHIAEDSLRVQLGGRSDLPSVTLTILADEVRVLDSVKQLGPPVGK